MSSDHAGWRSLARGFGFYLNFTLIALAVGGEEFTALATAVYRLILSLFLFLWLHPFLSRRVTFRL